MTTKRKPPARTIRKRSTTKTDPMLDVKADIERLSAISLEKAALADEEKVLRENIMKALDKSKKKSSTQVTGDGHRITVTRVAPSRVVLDHEKLKRRIGVTLWNKISTRELDKKKLDTQVSNGSIKGTDLAACSDEVEGTPYIKVTTK